MQLGHSIEARDFARCIALRQQIEQLQSGLSDAYAYDKREAFVVDKGTVTLPYASAFVREGVR